MNNYTLLCNTVLLATLRPPRHGGCGLTVVDTVVGGSVEHPLQRAQPIDHLCVDPELVEQVELLVSDVRWWGYQQRHWQVEELEGGGEGEREGREQKEIASMTGRNMRPHVTLCSTRSEQVSHMVHIQIR